MAIDKEAWLARLISLSPSVLVDGERPSDPQRAQNGAKSPQHGGCGSFSWEMSDETAGIVEPNCSNAMINAEQPRLARKGENCIRPHVLSGAFVFIVASISTPDFTAGFGSAAAGELPRTPIVFEEARDQTVLEDVYLVPNQSPVVRYAAGPFGKGSDYLFSVNDGKTLATGAMPREGYSAARRKAEDMRAVKVKLSDSIRVGPYVVKASTEYSGSSCVQMLQTSLTVSVQKGGEDHLYFFARRSHPTVLTNGADCPDPAPLRSTVDSVSFGLLSISDDEALAIGINFPAVIPIRGKEDPKNWFSKIPHVRAFPVPLIEQRADNARTLQSLDRWIYRQIPD